MNKFLRLIVIVFILSIYLLTFAQGKADDDYWVTKAKMPTGRLGPGVAAVNGKIYVIGGINEDGELNTNEEYDPVTDIWTARTSMPTKRSAFAIVAYANKIYVIGGGGDFGFDEVTGINEVYDPLTEPKLLCPQKEITYVQTLLMIKSI